MWTEEIVAGRPAWRQIPSGVVFREVPGGAFRMGLSDSELDAVRAVERSGGVEDTIDPFLASAKDAQPVREVHVESFLLARHPLTVAQVRHWLPEYDDDYAEADTGTARFEGDLEGLLELLPFDLPSEAQWEYAARAGTTTLTFHGDGKPDEDQLLDDFGDETRTAAGENAFGLAAMGSANELCADVWIPAFDGAPSTARPRTGDGPRTVRGGAADLYPWQCCDEWLLLLSATRYEHADFTAVRPAAPLPPTEAGGNGSVASRQAGSRVAEQGCGAPPFGLTARTARVVPRQHRSPVRTCRPDTTLRDESGRSRRIPDLDGVLNTRPRQATFHRW